MVAGRLSEGVGLRVCEGEDEGRGQGQGRDEAKVRVAAEHGGSIAYAVMQCICTPCAHHARAMQPRTMAGVQLQAHASGRAPPRVTPLPTSGQGRGGTPRNVATWWRLGGWGLGPADRLFASPLPSRLRHATAAPPLSAPLLLRRTPPRPPPQPPPPPHLRSPRCATASAPASAAQVAARPQRSPRG